jgi:hypothetical protein
MKSCKLTENRRYVLTSFLMLMILVARHGQAQVKVTTVAGGFINDGKPATSVALQSATSAKINFPIDVAIDSKGDILFSDSGNCVPVFDAPREIRDLDFERVAIVPNEVHAELVLDPTLL